MYTWQEVAELDFEAEMAKREELRKSVESPVPSRAKATVYLDGTTETAQPAFYWPNVDFPHGIWHCIHLNLRRTG